jgi:hypothetical protein
VKILFDLNVLLDVAYRPQRYPHSVQLYHRLVATRQHQGTFPACGYTTLYYQLRRNLPSARDARDTLLEWHQHLALLPFTDRMALAAHRLSMPDFEDACVAYSGSHACRSARATVIANTTGQARTVGGKGR